MSEQKDTCLISCGILREELERIIEKKGLEVELHFLVDSKHREADESIGGIIVSEEVVQRFIVSREEPLAITGTVGAGRLPTLDPIEQLLRLAVRVGDTTSPRTHNPAADTPATRRTGIVSRKREIPAALRAVISCCLSRSVSKISTAIMRANGVTSRKTWGTRLA